MQISSVQQGAVVEVVAAGRLDESWADHLASALDDVVRGGTHHIHLNMESVTYLSSAGIRVLIGCYNDLKEINGSFAVTSPSRQVRTILDMTRLSPILLSDTPDVVAASPAPAPEHSLFTTENGAFELLEMNPVSTLQCRVFGDPARFETGGYVDEDMTSAKFPANAFGIGIGAFGPNFSDCRDRFGEFLAAGGAAAYLPTDGASVPDYLVTAGSLVPEVGVLYGFRCEGSFAHQLRFHARGQARDVGLAELVSACLERSGSTTAGIVIVAESTGLVGAALRRSPAAERASSQSPFVHPDVRKWLTFTAEPAHAGSLCLVAGIASASETPGFDLAPLLRPMVRRDGAALNGHFHAAAFPYRPIQKGRLDLEATVGLLFEAQGPQGLLHLLCDDREATGAGESRFVRGACWVAPIAEGVREAV